MSPPSAFNRKILNWIIQPKIVRQYYHCYNNIDNDNYRNDSYYLLNATADQTFYMNYLV